MRFYTLNFSEQECVLLRNLIDVGIKQGGLVGARQLIAIDDKIVAAGEQQNASGNGQKIEPIQFDNPNSGKN